MPLPVRFLTFSLMLSTPALLLAAGQSVEYQEGVRPMKAIMFPPVKMPHW